MSDYGDDYRQTTRDYVAAEKRDRLFDYMMAELAVRSILEREQRQRAAPLLRLGPEGRPVHSASWAAWAVSAIGIVGILAAVLWAIAWVLA